MKNHCEYTEDFFAQSDSNTSAPSFTTVATTIHDEPSKNSRGKKKGWSDVFVTDEDISLVNKPLYMFDHDDFVPTEAAASSLSSLPFPKQVAAKPNTLFSSDIEAAFSSPPSTAFHEKTLSTTPSPKNLTLSPTKTIFSSPTSICDAFQLTNQMTPFSPTLAGNKRKNQAVPNSLVVVDDDDDDPFALESMHSKTHLTTFHDSGFDRMNEESSVLGQQLDSDDDTDCFDDFCDDEYFDIDEDEEEKQQQIDAGSKTMQRPQHNRSKICSSNLGKVSPKKSAIVVVEPQGSSQTEHSINFSSPRFQRRQPQQLPKTPSKAAASPQSNASPYKVIAASSPRIYLLGTTGSGNNSASYPVTTVATTKSVTPRDQGLSDGQEEEYGKRFYSIRMDFEEASRRSHNDWEEDGSIQNPAITTTKTRHKSSSLSSLDPASSLNDIKTQRKGNVSNERQRDRHHSARTSSRTSVPLELDTKTYHTGQASHRSASLTDLKTKKVHPTSSKISSLSSSTNPRIQRAKLNTSNHRASSRTTTAFSRATTKLDVSIDHSGQTTCASEAQSVSLADLDENEEKCCIRSPLSSTSDSPELIFEKKS